MSNWCSNLKITRQSKRISSVVEQERYLSQLEVWLHEKERQKE